MPEYTIHGGAEGKRRLEILSRTIGPGTDRFLKKAGISPGMNCLDLGCGSGDVTMAMAALVGVYGHVLGVDLDEHKIQSANASVQQRDIKNAGFKTFNAYDLKDESAYEVVYSRFLLSHLGKPEDVLQKIALALKTNGIILIEDTDFSGHFCSPASSDFNSYINL